MVNSAQLDRYKNFVDEEVISSIYRAAEQLADVHVLHINTTAEGGGVAEILKRLLPIMEELGIKHTWKIVSLDETSNHFTDHLVDMLQGNVPGTIDPEGRRRLLDRLSHSLNGPEDNHADIYFVHDFQLVPLASLFPWMRPAIWFSHIDTANPNPQAKQYTLDFLDPYEIIAFNSQPSVFQELPPERTQVIHLGIDPFRVKNRPLSSSRGVGLLAKCGIDISRPLITQVSRFGRWKNPWQVIDVYRLVKKQIPSIQVALVGAMEAADDISALDVLADVKRYADGDPDIHLLSDATLVGHLEVNAFQRYSSVILQRSTREGFGFTATEALWKSQPVVGTTATGMRAQLIEGYNGFLIDDTEGCAAYTLKLLQDRALWRTMGKNAHEHVRTHFLFPIMIMDYLETLIRALARSRASSAA